MTYRLPRLKTVILAAVLLLVLATGFFIARSSLGHKVIRKGGDEPKPQTAVPFNIKTGDFTYKPLSGWSILSKETLAASDATSGIGTSSPAATFTIKVSSAVPKNNQEQEQATLSELKKLSHFELLSSGDAKIDSKDAKKLVYRFGDSSKVKQELYVIVNNQKTYFLLFSSSEQNFDKKRADFDKILEDFKLN